MDNLLSFLGVIAPRLAAGDWLCVGPAEDDPVFVRVAQHAIDAGGRPSGVGRCAADQPPPAANVALVLLGPSLSIEQLRLWLARMSDLGEPVLIGCHELPQGGADSLLSAPLATTRLTFPGGFWYASREATLLPEYFPADISGSLAPTRLTSAADGLGVIHDRGDFLAISGKGIACRYHDGGGETFPNPLPESHATPEALTADLKVMGGYMPLEKSEGASLLFLRNVAVSGRIGILYDKDNSAIEESFAFGKAIVPTYRENLPTYDFFVKSCQFSLDGNSAPHLGAYRSSYTTEIDQPVVVTYNWDLACYNHWLNYQMTRFWYLDSFPELRRLPVVTGPLSRRFHHEYLALLGLTDLTFIQFHLSATLKLSRAYLPTLADPPPHSPGSVDWLRDRLLPKAAAVPAGYESGLYYISRGDSLGRRVVGGDEIAALVHKSGFKTLEFSQFSIAEQIALMRNAKVVIAPHGSSMSNIIFADPECIVVDMMPTRDAMLNDKLNALSPEIALPPIRRGSSYFILLAKGGTQGDYWYDFKEFEAIFEQVMAKLASQSH